MRNTSEMRLLPRLGVRLSLLGLSALLAALLAWPHATASAAPACELKKMYIDAHQDDDLLFQSPDLLEDLEAGNCVQTVFVTAGDAGRPESYWHTREEGSQAAYAEMAGVADIWTASEPVFEGVKLHMATLVADPDVTQIYMRLPDGNDRGTGFPATGNQSLPKLWASQNPEPELSALTPITQIGAVDGSATYSYEGLIATLAAVIDSFQPDSIATQNFTGNFGEGDHFDHTATAKFANLAIRTYRARHVLRSYLGYQTKTLAANVPEPELALKSQAFYTYGSHDSEVCSSASQCEESPFGEYAAWLKRQVTMTETAVPGASAGPPRTGASEAEFVLDGSASSDPLGKALTYEWTQTGGPAVNLVDPSSTTPSFKAPVGSAELTFSLVVRTSEATSLPSSTAVTVAAPVPPPKPEAPMDEPTTGGSPAPIQSGTPAAPSPEPARSLPEVQAARLGIVTGRPSRHVIRVTGSPKPTVSCRGALPRNLICRVRKSGDVVVRSTRAPIPVGRYRITVVASSSAGNVARPFNIAVRSPQH